MCARTVQFLLLIVLFIMRKRIKLVTALFKEAGKAIQAMPFLLLQPLIVSTFRMPFVFFCEPFVVHMCWLNQPLTSSRPVPTQEDPPNLTLKRTKDVF